MGVVARAHAFVEQYLTSMVPRQVLAQEAVDVARQLTSWLPTHRPMQVVQQARALVSLWDSMQLTWPKEPTVVAPTITQHLKARFDLTRPDPHRARLHSHYLQRVHRHADPARDLPRPQLMTRGTISDSRHTTWKSTMPTTARWKKKMLIRKVSTSKDHIGWVEANPIMLLFV